MREKEKGGNGTVSYQQKPVPNYSHLLVYQIGKGITSGPCVQPVSQSQPHIPIRGGQVRCIQLRPPDNPGGKHF